MYQVGVYAMWLGLLFDTNATLQGDGDAFCIAGVAFFRGVMHLGRRVMHWGEACFTGGSVAFGVHEMGYTLYAAGEEVGAIGLEGVAVVSKAVHNDC